MAGEEPKRGKRGRKKSSASKKVRKARAERRREKPDGRRRAHLIMAIAHPLRRRILRVLHEHGEPLSPVQLSRALGEPLGTVAYHAGVLRRFHAVEPAGERQVRGGVEHFYDSAVEDDPPIETMLEETKDADDEDK